LISAGKSVLHSHSEDFRDRGAEQSWQIFKDAFQSVRALSPQVQEVRQEGKRSEWRPAGQTKGQEETAQAVEVGAGNLERV